MYISNIYNLYQMYKYTNQRRYLVHRPTTFVWFFYLQLHIIKKNIAALYREMLKDNATDSCRRVQYNLVATNHLECSLAPWISTFNWTKGYFWKFHWFSLFFTSIQNVAKYYLDFLLKNKILLFFRHQKWWRKGTWLNIIMSEFVLLFCSFIRFDENVIRYSAKEILISFLYPSTA